ncbi:Homeobox protein homothorax [Vespula maculifrons]|uniref:Homeobox protein homothorax n=1 Tax=Vespula maculifrons TaxID=7453 RepID=A0ABD2D1F3_VESMC
MHRRLSIRNCSGIYHTPWYAFRHSRRLSYVDGDNNDNDNDNVNDDCDVSFRPPSSSLSYPGAGGNDDARSPGSGGTPGPLSQQAPTSLDSSDPVNLTSVAMTDHANGHARVQSVTGGNTSSRHHPIKIH